MESVERSGICKAAATPTASFDDEAKPSQSVPVCVYVELVLRASIVARVIDQAAL